MTQKPPGFGTVDEAFLDEIERQCAAIDGVADALDAMVDGLEPSDGDAIGERNYCAFRYLVGQLRQHHGALAKALEKATPGNRVLTVAA